MTTGLLVVVVTACTTMADYSGVVATKELVPVEIQASIDGPRATFDGVSKTVWEAGDSIAVASDQDSVIYVLRTEAGGANATFTGLLPQGFTAGKAYYPVTESLVNSKEKFFSTAIAQEQKCRKDGVASGVAPMCTSFEEIGSGLMFHQLTALLRFQVSGSDVTMVEIEVEPGSDSGTLHSRLTNIDCEHFSTETIYGNPIVRLVPENGGTFAPGTYYAAIPARAEARRFDGLKIRYFLQDGKVLQRESSNPISVERATIYNIPGNEGDCTELGKPQSVRVLCIGNSFSADAVEQELYGFFEEAGIEVVIGNMYIGGCPLSKHAANATADAAAYSYRKIVNGVLTKKSSYKLSTALADEDWDFISVQEGAGFHGYYDRTYTTKQSEVITHKMEPDLTTLIEYCKANSSKKDFKLIYHACWAAQVGYTRVKFSYYDFDQALMYDMVREATQQVRQAHPEIDVVINTMDAVQNGRSSYLGDTFNRDGWHLNYTIGRYTAGALWFEKLTGINVLSMSYRPTTVTEYEGIVCRTAAHKAALNPYSVTDLSKMFYNQGEEPVDPTTRVLAEWYFTPQRAVSDGNVYNWTKQNTIGTCHYTNDSGEVGFYTATANGAGRISYVQIDKHQWDDKGDAAGLYVLSVSTGGQPCTKGSMPGDYWLFETTGGYEFEEGTRIDMIYQFLAGDYGLKFYMVEYLDGQTWKPVPGLDVKTLTLSGKTFTYNLNLPKDTRTIISFSVTLEEPTTEFKVRQTCASTYQVNDKNYDYPNVKSVQRITGVPGDATRPCPKITQILN